MGFGGILFVVRGAEDSTPCHTTEATAGPQAEQALSLQAFVARHWD